MKNMSKYMDADKLEKDGWNIQRIRQASLTEMIYETKKPTDFPAADVVEVRHGRWKDIPFTARWICSNCDYISEFASFKYCPDCGSIMDLEDEE